MINSIKSLFHFGDDAASEKEIIESIKSGVDFRGAKLWILIIAVFVASLGLNTNSAAVIIGAMLISPLMGPILGMGLSVGTYDIELLRRSFRNFIIATIFSILTATVYFLITPINTVQSELLARTSPSVYDVLIALCGGLAGIIGLSSRSQRTGNVIPGVAIATALMPPLCTVGFGIATGNWSYAAGALYLFVINTIFISLATFIGARFIMNFEQKMSLEQTKDKKIKRIIYAVVIITILPATVLTFGMVRANYFEQRVSRFIEHEMHFPMSHIISYSTDFQNKSFDVVLIGQTLDSIALQTSRERLALYQLEGVTMNVIQDNGAERNAQLSQQKQANNRELANAEKVIAEQQVTIAQLEDALKPYNAMQDYSAKLLKEMQILCPQAQSITTAMATTANADSTLSHPIVIVGLSSAISKQTEASLTQWLKERMEKEEVKVVFE